MYRQDDCVFALCGHLEQLRLVGVLKAGWVGFLFTRTYVCEQWQHKTVNMMTSDSPTRNSLIGTVWSWADTEHEWQQRTVCEASEAEFVYVPASANLLSAAANSGDYSNLILNKLQEEKYAEDQAAVACVWQEQSVLSWWGRRMLLSLHLASLTPRFWDLSTVWLSNQEMEKRGYVLSCHCMSVWGRWGCSLGSESGKAAQDRVQDKLPFSFRFQNCETEPSCTGPQFV